MNEKAALVKLSFCKRKTAVHPASLDTFFENTDRLNCLPVFFMAGER
ncbi:hypothetical protein [Comamonas sp. CMM02]|nr:hypothetical protein [Comamonas sp. CMM02]